MKDFESRITTITNLFESIYYKNICVITKKNQKIWKMEKGPHIHNLFKCWSTVSLDLRRQINLTKLKEFIENNPQIKGFKLYELVFKLLKPHLDDELNKKWAKKSGSFITLNHEFVKIIEETTKKLRGMSIDELKDTVKIIKGWKKMNNNLNKYTMYSNLNWSIWNSGLLSKVDNKNKVTSDLIQKEIWSAYTQINYDNPYDNSSINKESLKDLFNKESQKDENFIKKWETLILSKHPKGLNKDEIVKHVLEEFKKNLNSRKEKFLNKIACDDFYEKEQLDHLKENYLKVLKKVDTLEVNPNQNWNGEWKAFYVYDDKSKSNKINKEVII